MSVVSAGVLDKQVSEIKSVIQADRWLTQPDSQKLRDNILHAFAALPLPDARVTAGFDSVCTVLSVLSGLAHQPDENAVSATANGPQQCLETYADFFAGVESSPLNTSQSEAVVNQ